MDCHLKEAKKQVDEFISDYKDMPNRVYTLISGKYHLKSTCNLHDMQEYMYHSLQETVEEWDEDGELYYMTFEAFGDLRLLITHNINHNKPIHLNITGNQYMKYGPCVFNCIDCPLPLDGFYHPVINAQSESSRSELLGELERME
jgi:hypothetical protein